MVLLDADQDEIERIVMVLSKRDLDRHPDAPDRPHGGPKQSSTEQANLAQMAAGDSVLANTPISVAVKELGYAEPRRGPSHGPSIVSAHSWPAFAANEHRPDRPNRPTSTNEARVVFSNAAGMLAR